MCPYSFIMIPHGLTNISFPQKESDYCIFTHSLNIYDSIIYHLPPFPFHPSNPTIPPPFRQSQKSLSTSTAAVQKSAPRWRWAARRLKPGSHHRVSCVRFEPLSLFGCFPKYWYPQIINLNRVFHYKPSILGYPYFWKHPFSFYVHIH